MEQRNTCKSAALFVKILPFPTILFISPQLSLDMDNVLHAVLVYRTVPKLFFLVWDPGKVEVEVEVEGEGEEHYNDRCTVADL